MRLNAESGINSNRYIRRAACSSVYAARALMTVHCLFTTYSHEGLAGINWQRINGSEREERRNVSEHRATATHWQPRARAGLETPDVDGSKPQQRAAVTTHALFGLPFFSFPSFCTYVYFLWRLFLRQIVGIGRLLNEAFDGEAETEKQQGSIGCFATRHMQVSQFIACKVTVSYSAAVLLRYCPFALGYRRL